MMLIQYVSYVFIIIGLSSGENLANPWESALLVAGEWEVA